MMKLSGSFEGPARQHRHDDEDELLTKLPPHSAPPLPAHGHARAFGNNLFVANLSGDVTDADLLRVFSPFGAILSAKVMLDIHTGVSRGFGFVMFETDESGNAAGAALAGTPLGAKGNRMNVSRAQTSGASAITETTKLYVRNVPRSVPESVLRDHFARFGAVRKFVRKEDTAPKPAAADAAFVPAMLVVFLEYASTEEATAAVRGIHNTRPWPGMHIPLMAKAAETAENRNARRERQKQREEEKAVFTQSMEMLSTSVQCPDSFSHSATMFPVSHGPSPMKASHTPMNASASPPSTCYASPPIGQGPPVIVMSYPPTYTAPPPPPPQGNAVYFMDASGILHALPPPQTSPMHHQHQHQHQQHLQHQQHQQHHQHNQQQHLHRPQVPMMVQAPVAQPFGFGPQPVLFPSHLSPSPQQWSSPPSSMSHSQENIHPVPTYHIPTAGSGPHVFAHVPTFPSAH